MFKLCTKALLPLVLLAVAGCSSGGAPQFAAADAALAAPDWRNIATAGDRSRLRGWRTAFTTGLRQAAAAGHAGEIASEGVLLQPDAALSWEDPPAGDYACRIIKVGAKTPGLLDYVSYPAFDCRIRQEDGMLSFAKLTGSQRPLGLMLPMSGDRMVFLGTLQLGDERRALQYGRDRERDMAGVVERIGEDRWRLFFPYPHFESTIDVLELVPKGAAS
jgi:hypothetical protein